MKTLKKITLLVLLLLPSVSHADEVLKETGRVDFAGGLNVKTAPGDIKDDESPNMSNMMEYNLDSCVLRNGMHRYISQAISTNPVSSIFRSYITTGTVVRRTLFAANRDRIYISTDDNTPQWIAIATGLAGQNQQFSWTTAGNKVILTGNGLTDNIKQYDILQSSFQDLLSNDGSTGTISIRGKYAMNIRNYLLVANGSQVDLSTTPLTAGTTYFPSRLWYSKLLIPSSFTANSYLEIGADDGDYVTGLGFMNKFVDIFKQGSIYDLSFSNLSPTGDQSLAKIVDGFGCIAPGTLQNLGLFYIFLARDGVRIWDGGERTTLSTSEQSKIISTPIEPIINSLIKSGKYVNAVGKWYPKRSWYVLSWEDSNVSPHGVNNSVLVYDFNENQWFPFSGLKIASLESAANSGDSGTLFGSDASDGYVYILDSDSDANDARKEVPISNMDNAADWLRSAQDTGTVIEGTASLKLTMSASTIYSSMTFMRPVNFGEWWDGTRASNSDKISFKVYPSTISNLISVRVDLEVNDVDNEFDTNFTSFTVSSAALTNGNTMWSTVEIPISSFPILDSWINLQTEQFPFANTMTFYGIRFVSSGTGGGNSSVNIDDLRLVQGSPNSISAYRYTKQYDFGTSADKAFRQVYVNAEIPKDGIFYIDTIGNFGETSNRIQVSGGYNKEIYVAGFNGSENITKLNSNDFSVLDSTVVAFSSVAAFRAMTDDESYVYSADRYNHSIYKIAKSSLGVTTFVSTFGSVGSGNNQFYNIWQMAVDKNYLYVADMSNYRIKVHNKNNLSFVQSFGLGVATTSVNGFHLPTGVAVNAKYCYVGDDGNNRLMKLYKSSGAFISSTSVNINTFGGLTLAVDESYLYDAFQTISSSAPDFVDVFLEKRDSESLQLLNRVRVLPQFSMALSTYNIMGNLACGGDYIYITFTDDANGNGSYYLQKRLKSDFSIVREYKSSNALYDVAAIGTDFTPRRRTFYKTIASDGGYLQLKYSANSLDNPLKLNSQNFLVVAHPVQEKQ